MCNTKGDKTLQNSQTYVTLSALRLHECTAQEYACLCRLRIMLFHVTYWLCGIFLQSTHMVKDIFLSLNAGYTRIHVYTYTHVMYDCVITRGVFRCCIHGAGSLV